MTKEELAKFEKLYSQCKKSPPGTPEIYLKEREIIKRWQNELAEICWREMLKD